MTTPTMRDGAVLPVEIGVRAFLDRGGDFLHARRAGVGRQHLAARHDAVEHGQHSGGDDHPIGYVHVF